MNLNNNADLARRFAGLPLPQRELFYRRLCAKGISFLQMPITRMCEGAGARPLSYAQQRQWFLWQLEPGSAAYHIPAALRLRGELDIEALKRSFAALVERHEGLRTTFRQEGDETQQVVHDHLPLEIREQSLGAVDEAALMTRIEEEVRVPFDLEHGPLLRVKLLRLAPDDHVLVLTMHHIVSDGWSTPIMVAELMQLYAGYREGRRVELEPLPIQYADYAVWQRGWMEAGERERQLGYWRQQLGGEQPVLELPTDRPRPAVQSTAGDSLQVELGEELGRSLKQVAQQHGVTLFMLMLASFQTLLHRYSGQNDIRVGVPIANRTRVETERLIGFFVNTQVLKAEFDLDTRFDALLQQVKRTALEAQAHQDLPFEQLVEALQPQRSLSHSPLFQVMYNHQAAGKDATLELPGLYVEVLGRSSATAQFDLTLDTYESDDGLSASLIYATSLFERETVERLALHWRNLLEAICRDAGQRVGELALLDEAEHARLALGYQSAPSAEPACLHPLVENQAARTPNATALACGEAELSYWELNRRANVLAHRLRAEGIGPDVLVGIAAQRNLELVVALLAVLKAGGTYVPMDPSYPAERLAFLAADSGIGLLLTQRSLLEHLPFGERLTSLCLDDLNLFQGTPAAWDENPENRTCPEHLAYVIYTSGSTGRPKGVGITHGALVNHMCWMQQRFQLAAHERVLQRTSTSFDASVWEFWLPLISGARLHLAPVELGTSLERLWALVEEQRINVLQMPPSLLQALLPFADENQLDSLRLLCCGGEALSGALLEQLGRRWNGELVNLYGPTEATIDACCFSTPVQKAGPSVPIGAPIAGVRMRILDNAGGVCPPGCRGELLIAGAALARGYLGRPGLTAERFVPDPYGTGERIYRTGDLAKLGSDGLLEYLGRLDHQVKIRGFRIELGEIEVRLLEQVGVREAVVLTSDSASGKQLLAYIVPTDVAVLEGERRMALRDSLKAVLRGVLPEYMVPNQWLFLEAMPLLPNGKLDRKALPAPDSSESQPLYMAPKTDLEQSLAAIWAEVLKLERVGRSDNFFELGGHSLLATQVLVRVREQLRLEMALKELFEFPVLAELARQLQGRNCVDASVQDELAKSLEALKRLTTEEIDALTS
ncbi:non-ribosomal peptide synthetase [Ectopseudomonas mendocina]|uniref:Non-ribosomal peptide synthetase n=1 Tax=Ectopseudomonas mendocina TaxID=300 RepID=A0A2R3QTA3_ECTME|nr:non-ribosomal peptide synthetase [Pseudomonas mendocina]AVO54973.1 non-ribosomal peptide synthetase [Pseudomonas mendocina]